MLSRSVRCVALAACLFSLVGCAEFGYRGGVVAQVEDWVLFRAVTKSHRLLRSYTLAASLMAITRVRPSMTTVERKAIAGRLQAVLKIAQEAYFCLYPDRMNKPAIDLAIDATKLAADGPVTSCIFFDSRMAELDYAIYKLAAEVLVDPDSASAIATVRNQLLNTVPALQKAVLATTKGLEAANHAAGAVFDATTFLNALVEVSYTSGGRWIYISAVYRDVLEFDMRLVLQVLRYQCLSKANSYACKAFDEGAGVFNKGNGKMDEWRRFIKQENDILNDVEAYPFHFALASRWLYNSCAAIYGGEIEDAAAIEEAIKKNCDPLIEKTDTTKRKFVINYRDGRKPDPEELTAKRLSPSRLVQPGPQQLGPIPPAQAASPAPQPATPGAMPRASGTTGQAH